MSKAWIEDLWLTEPRETLPDGSKVKIPVPSSVTKSLAAYMKTPEKAKVPEKFKTARYGHGKRWRVSWWATLPDGSKKRSSKACLLSSCGSPLWRVVSVRKSGGN